MYCPRCMKTIPDEKIGEISERLKNDMGNTLLAEKKCPVCGTELLPAQSKGVADAAGSE